MVERSDISGSLHCNTFPPYGIRIPAGSQRIHERTRDSSGRRGGPCRTLTRRRLLRLHSVFWLGPLVAFRVEEPAVRAFDVVPSHLLQHLIAQKSDLASDVRQPAMRRRELMLALKQAGPADLYQLSGGLLLTTWPVPRASAFSSRRNSASATFRMACRCRAFLDQ